MHWTMAVWQLIITVMYSNRWQQILKRRYGFLVIINPNFRGCYVHGPVNVARHKHSHHLNNRSCPYIQLIHWTCDYTIRSICHALNPNTHSRHLKLMFETAEQSVSHITWSRYTPGWIHRGIIRVPYSPKQALLNPIKDTILYPLLGTTIKPSL